MTDRITTEGDNECTAYPWWAIVDPRHGLVPAREMVRYFASAITGPYFSRAAAQEHLEVHRYNYGKYAAVYCFSGHKSYDYRDRIDAAKDGSR